MLGLAEGSIQGDSMLVGWVNGKVEMPTPQRRVALLTIHTDLDLLLMLLLLLLLGSMSQGI